MSAPPSATLTPPQFDSPSPNSSPSSSIVTVIIIVASAVTASATIYLFLRFLSNRLFHGRFFSAAADEVVLRSGSTSSYLPCHVAFRGLLDSLPLFSFRSVTGNIAGGGHCAVCLSKFEPDDRLRLLPLCCHVFHADCIDAWIVFNQTCPLCRSTVIPCGSDALDKILFLNNRHESVAGGNFRIEIGSISRHCSAGGGARRSYSLGSFEYIVDENECEVPVDCTTHRRGVSDDVKLEIPTAEAEALAKEVSGGRNWLREYVDKISSRATSFRSSGRMFVGSISRHSEVVIVPEELEVTRIGEEFG